MIHKNIAIAVPTIRSIGNIVSSNVFDPQTAIDSGILSKLNDLIQNKKKTIRKEVCWTLSNIIVGPSEIVQQCIDIGIIDKAIDIVLNDDTEVKKEAV